MSLLLRCATASSSSSSSSAAVLPLSARLLSTIAARSVVTPARATARLYNYQNLLYSGTSATRTGVPSALLNHRHRVYQHQQVAWLSVSRSAGYAGPAPETSTGVGSAGETGLPPPSPEGLRAALASKPAQATTSALKQQQQQQRLAQQQQQQQQQQSELTVVSENADSEKIVVKPAAPAKKPLSVRIKEELLHYWDGTKLLWLEMKISNKLLWKMLQGQELTRREQRQLKRTTIDMGRLIPFSIFIIVPFMEFLLPVAIKLFPNMMPSTYESASDREKKAKKQSEIRLEVSKLLRESMAESIKARAAVKAAAKQQQHHQQSVAAMAVVHSSVGEEAATTTSSTTATNATEDAFDIIHRARATGVILSTDELAAISKMFDDDLTLDNLSRQQLVGLCRFLGGYTFGTDNMLRNQIGNKLRYLKADDRMILAEGVDELTVPELQQACAARGLPSTGASPARMRDELHHWLTLHLEHKMPSVILLLTRALTTVDPVTLKEGQTFAPEALQATLSALPENLVSEAELKDDEKMGTATSKQKLEVLEQQEELIEDEAEQEQSRRSSRSQPKSKSSTTTTAATSEKQ